jgi:hypothetical protein
MIKINRVWLAVAILLLVFSSTLLFGLAPGSYSCSNFLCWGCTVSGNWDCGWIDTTGLCCGYCWNYGEVIEYRVCCYPDNCYLY